ncbi:hypothetical protein [Acinetobacter seifertii]|uniref:hypothetical protein n=1 Tax=Acinetobacter seifertii TaxID=1530123 RepID=UPI0032B4D447
MGGSFSWELVSKFTSLLAPIVAWLIFSQWNKQKGREVIANECKDGFKDILEIAKILSDINYGLKLRPSKKIEEKISSDIEQFEIINRRIIRNLLFVDSTIIEQNLYPSTLKYRDSYQEMRIMLEIKMKMYGFQGECKTQEFYEKFITSTKDITDIYKKYALYQKTPKFRKKKEV